MVPTQITTSKPSIGQCSGLLDLEWVGGEPEKPLQLKLQLTGSKGPKSITIQHPVPQIVDLSMQEQGILPELISFYN